MPHKDPAAARAYWAAWRAKNRERARAASRRYRERNRDKEREAAKARYAADIDKHRARRRARAKRDYAADPEKWRQRGRTWRAANPDKMAAAMRRWDEENPGVRAAIKAKRRAAMRAQTPILTAEEQARIVGFYSQARHMTEITGEPYHVDHIKPLAKGGLHHPDNLQVLRGRDNLRKGAR